MQACLAAARGAAEGHTGPAALDKALRTLFQTEGESGVLEQVCNELSTASALPAVDAPVELAAVGVLSLALLRVGCSGREAFYAAKAAIDAAEDGLHAALLLEVCLQCTVHQRGAPRPFNSAVEEDVHESVRALLAMTARRCLLSGPAHAGAGADFRLYLAVTLAFVSVRCWGAGLHGAPDIRTWHARLDTLADALWSCLLALHAPTSARDAACLASAGTLLARLLCGDDSGALHFDADRAAALCGAAARGLLDAPQPGAPPARGGLSHVTMQGRDAPAAAAAPAGVAGGDEGDDARYLSLAHAAFPSLSPVSYADSTEEEEEEGGGGGAPHTAREEAEHGRSRITCSTGQKKLALLLVFCALDGEFAGVHGAGPPVGAQQRDDASHPDASSALHPLLHSSSAGSHGAHSLLLSCASRLSERVVHSGAPTRGPTLLPAVLHPARRVHALLPHVAVLVRAAAATCMQAVEVEGEVMGEGGGGGLPDSGSMATREAAACVSMAMLALRALLRSLYAAAACWPCINVPPCAFERGPGGEASDGREMEVEGGSALPPPPSPLQLVESSVEGVLLHSTLTLLTHMRTGARDGGTPSGVDEPTRPRDEEVLRVRMLATSPAGHVRAVRACPDPALALDDVSLCLATFHALLSSCDAPSRLRLTSALLDVCPYTTVQALLVDRLRHDCAVGGESVPPALPPLLLRVVGWRVRQGLLRPATLFSPTAASRPGLEASAEYAGGTSLWDGGVDMEGGCVEVGGGDARTPPPPAVTHDRTVERLLQHSAPHLASFTALDVALMGLCRHLVLVQSATPSPSPPWAASMRDTFLAPLMQHVTVMQEALRVRAGVGAFHAHAHPSGGGGGGVVSLPSSSVPHAMVGMGEPETGEGGEVDKGLSTTLVYEAALVPTLRALDKVGARSS